MVEHWMKTQGEGALKALNYVHGLFQIIGNYINVVEESPKKVFSSNCM